MTGLPDLGERRASERAGWAELEALVARLEKGGERSLSFAEINRMGALYRHGAAQLADARQRSHDRARTQYLDALVRHAHFVIYAPPRRGLRPFWSLVSGGFARAFRDTRAFQAFALALFVAGGAVGYLATDEHVELSYPILGMMFPAELVQGMIESDEIRASYITLGQTTGMGTRSAFAVSLAANNARVGLASFSVGIALGVPTMLMQLMNGAVLGSMSALYDRGGFNLEWWAWVLPHAVPEVLALCVCAAAGLLMGMSLVDPKGRPRRQALVRAGRTAALLVGFAIILFAYAALIEGYFRQTMLGPVPRFALALFNLTMLSLYLGLAGRDSRSRTQSVIKADLRAPAGARATAPASQW